MNITSMDSNADYAPLVKLVQVKRGIYNPHLPTYLQRDIDNQLGKLHDEQRVTTVPRGHENYPQGIAYSYMSPCSYVRGYSILPFYRTECMLSKDSLDLSFLEHCKWADFRRQLPMPEGRITNIARMSGSQVMSFSAPAMPPEIGESWRNKMTGPIEINETYIEELFPQIKIHECLCTEPRKQVPRIENLCLPENEPENLSRELCDTCKKAKNVSKVPNISCSGEEIVPISKDNPTTLCTQAS